MNKPRIPVFYSFHHGNDAFRVQQIRNMGVVDGLAPVTANAWVEVTRRGDKAIENWIDESMKYRRCVVVLIGEETASRKWVKYEIKKAWKDGRGLLGIHIHNLKAPGTGTCSKGPNPFAQFNVGGTRLSQLVKTYTPGEWWESAYDEIKANLASWVEAAVDAAKYRE